MKNVEELRKELVSVFDGLKSGEIDVKVASEMNRACGQIIKSCAVQLEYQSYRTDSPVIEFLEGK